MIKVTALGKVSQMNFSFYQNISKKEGINIQWSIPTLLPTPYIRHHKKRKRKKALHFHCLTDLKLPHTSVTSSDGLKRENMFNVRIRLATFCVQRRTCGQTKRGRGAEEYKSNRGGYRVRVANATQWTHNPLLLGEYRRKQQSHGRQALTYKML